MRIAGKALGPRRGRDFFRRVQMIFQDPYGSLHPRQTVDRALSEPLLVHRIGDIDMPGGSRARRGVAAARSRGSVTRTSYPAASASASPLRGR